MIWRTVHGFHARYILRCQVQFLDWKANQGLVVWNGIWSLAGQLPLLPENNWKQIGNIWSIWNCMVIDMIMEKYGDLHVPFFTVMGYNYPLLIWHLLFKITAFNHQTLWAFCYSKLLNYQRVLDDTSESGWICIMGHFSVVFRNLNYT